LSTKDRKYSQAQQEQHRAAEELAKKRDKDRLNQEIAERHFSSAERVTEESMARQRQVERARTLQGELQDFRLLNAQDAAPIYAGQGQNDYANPSTPLNIRAGNSRISPPNTGFLSPRQLYPQPTFVSPRKSTRTKKARQLYQPETGKGIIYGRGFNLTPESIKNRHYFGKFYLEKHKLADNILSVKYAGSDGHIPSLKVQTVTDNLKNLVRDVMEDKYNERLFDQLSKDERRVFKRFVKAIKLDTPTDDSLDKELQKNYQIALGEFKSGNTSPEVKNELKKYVVEGLAEGKINKHEAYFLLYQLSL